MAEISQSIGGSGVGWQAKAYTQTQMAMLCHQ